MRNLLSLALALLAGACAATPQPGAAPQPAGAAPIRPATSGSLVGLTASELIQRFGRPALQIRDGQGVKLQFRGRCVLDAYLYPPRPGQAERVAHVDTRVASGAGAELDSCIAALQRS